MKKTALAVLASFAFTTGSLALATPAQAAPPMLKNISINDASGDQTVFKPSVAKNVTSSVDIKSTSYSIVKHNGVRKLKLTITAKEFLPKASKFEQTFNVTAATKDAKDGFIAFYTRGEKPYVFVPDTERSPACDKATASTKLGKASDTATILIPTKCFSFASAVRLQTAGVVTNAKGNQTVAQDATRMTKNVVIK